MTALVIYAASPLLLLVLYLVGIQTERGGWWIVLWPVAICAQALSFLTNWLFFPWFFGFPKWGEWTFSKALSRLRNQYPSGQYIARMLDVMAPSGRHVR